jgi:prophage regulatory protein
MAMNNKSDSARLLPEVGYLRLSQIIGDKKKGIPALIPVSRSSWYKGLASGRIPAGVLLGPRTRGYSVESIRELIASFNEAAQ